MSPIGSRATGHGRPSIHQYWSGGLPSPLPGRGPSRPLEAPRPLIHTPGCGQRGPGRSTFTFDGVLTKEFHETE